MRSLETKRYVRRPFYVQAVRVTSKNMRDVAAWCKGVIELVNDSGHPRTQRFIRVDVLRPTTPRQTQAFIGDWVLQSGTSFKVYTPKAFEDAFEPAGDQTTLQSVNSDEEQYEVVAQPVQRVQQIPVAVAEETLMLEGGITITRSEWDQESEDILAGVPPRTIENLEVREIGMVQQEVGREVSSDPAVPDKVDKVTKTVPVPGPPKRKDRIDRVSDAITQAPEGVVNQAAVELLSNPTSSIREA